MAKAKMRPLSCFGSKLIRSKHESNQPPDVEEGSWPHYKRCKWYQAAPGQSIDTSYTIIAKLGYGTMSTVWLCRDVKDFRYVVAKIAVAQDWRPKKEMENLDMINKIKQRLSWQHPGAKLIRNYVGSVQIDCGRFSKHTCILYSPLGPSLKDVRSQYFQGRIPPHRLKPMVRHMLTALDFLHTQCNMVHTDVNMGNFMMMFNDQLSLEQLHRLELADPSKPHKKGNHTIYDTRNVLPISVSSVPILCGFSYAVTGKIHHNTQVTPDNMRPPEVILQLPWSDKIDIWCLGLLVWNCLEGRNWYDYKPAQRKRTEIEHMAYSVALLGTPSPRAWEWIKSGKKWADFFTEQAQPKFPALVPRTTLMEREYAMTDDHDERKAFFCFLSRMLQWNPECRATAAELLEDSWLG